MCGRFTNEVTWAELQALYSLSDEMFPTGGNLQPQYNIAPTQEAMFVRRDKAGRLELDKGRWWLVPHWAEEVPKATLFNARVETVDSTAAFRDAFRYRRCLVPADGYFEWTLSAEDGKKDPWLLQLPGGEPFSFAGLWARNDVLGVTSFTIITAPAVPHIEHIHGRMPVILEEGSYDAWLDTAVQGAEAKRLLLNHQLDDQLEFHQVSRSVNSSKYEGTDTKKPLINPL